MTPGWLASLHRQMTLPLKPRPRNLLFIPVLSFHSTSTVQMFSHVRLQSLISPSPCGPVRGMRSSTAEPATAKSEIGESNFSLQARVFRPETLNRASFLPSVRQTLKETHSLIGIFFRAVGPLSTTRGEIPF